MYNELKEIVAEKKDLRNFGLTFSLIFLILASVLFITKSNSFNVTISIALSFALTGLLVPVILKPLYFIWMVFSIVIGWIMTRIILSVLFYLIMTAIGQTMKLLNKDLLGLKKDADLDSYWDFRDSHSAKNQDFEKQF